MDILLKFGIGADSSTFGLARFATPRYEMGVFKTGVFKTGKIKTGFAENLGHWCIIYRYGNFAKKLARLFGQRLFWLAVTNYFGVQSLGFFGDKLEMAMLV